ncbi:unnamed protein product [Clonostachys rhizophaga]|uniref:Histidine kinase group protein n=1 Tax=Clonostachys rhizophaga TaxID=160324 RepID=A0A9N9VHY6_9HYPO|nr:unnamed protein product [Clonostachys rhizophaga]
MAKKKSKAVSIGESETMAPSAAPAPKPPATSASKPTKKSPSVASKTPASASLVICRNKHWRYISAFHGPWLQMPVEILETIANINYNTPRPRPIDPASFFDLVKVRRLVDEATNLAVRAASDIASPTLTNVNGGIPDISSLHSLGIGGTGHGAKLSRERKFRMREQASQKLARAYRLDEIACSVATMQGASPLEEVGSFVLQRNQKDPDAKYVHFFHEKIPSRQLAECTSLQPLTDIISERPGEPEALRTRATVKVFKEDYDGAAQDLTHALQICRYHLPSHTKTPGGEVQLYDQQRARRRAQDVILAEKDQPRSIEGQLLFQRASVYLTMACNHVMEGLRPGSPSGSNNPGPSADGDEEPESKGQNNETSKKEAEARKSVKLMAKRALRDYMAFLSHFEYSPNLSTRVVKDFNERVNSAAHGTRNPRVSDTSPISEHVVYSISDLFSAVPPTGLPPYPPQDLVKHDPEGIYHNPAATTCEWTTYHPLLADALHSLLLCHCLVQTSVKELQRHAYMVARIVRLCDGYPVFQASRSPARSDWIELLRRADNWLTLSSNWETLCVPAPLPMFDAPTSEMTVSVSSPELAASAAAALMNGNSPESVAEDLRKERQRERAILEALDDDRVVDEASFRAAIMAREKRAEEEHSGAAKANGSSNYTTDPAATTAMNKMKQPQHQHQHQLCHHCAADSPASQRWAADESKEYPLLTERAAAIALWVRDAPVVTGTTKRKKRTKKPPVGNAAQVDGAASAMQNLDVEDAKD